MYSEGLYIDYCWFNKEKIRFCFVFGYGFSYINFLFDVIIEFVILLFLVFFVCVFKGLMLVYLIEIFFVLEVYWLEGFNRIWWYFYFWFNKNDVDNVYVVGIVGVKKYNYFVGYSIVQKFGFVVGGGEGGNFVFWDIVFCVLVMVKNIGDMFLGWVLVQVYVQYFEGILYDMFVVQLRDFEKMRVLVLGEEEMVMVELIRKDLSVWDMELQNWVVLGVGGKRYMVWIGEVSDRLFMVCYMDMGVCEGGRVLFV